MQIEAAIREKFEKLMGMAEHSMLEHLGIEFEQVGKSLLSARMPVDHRTQQPFGILHGGASVVLAESLASIGAYLNIEDAERHAVGLEINANHIRSVRTGFVIGTAEPLHVGRSTQVWKISIVRDDGALVCESRCTLAVIGV